MLRYMQGYFIKGRALYVNEPSADVAFQMKMLLTVILRALITRRRRAVDGIFAELATFFKTEDGAVNGRLTDPASVL